MRTTLEQLKDILNENKKIEDVLESNAYLYDEILKEDCKLDVITFILSDIALQTIISSLNIEGFDTFKLQFTIYVLNINSENYMYSKDIEKLKVLNFDFIDNIIDSIKPIDDGNLFKKICSDMLKYEQCSPNYVKYIIDLEKKTAYPCAKYL